MHLRVQGLDPAVHHFRKAGVVGHFGDRQAIVLQQAIGAPGRQQLHAHSRRALANSTTPDLSETLIRARLTLTRLVSLMG